MPLQGVWQTVSAISHGLIAICMNVVSNCNKLLTDAKNLICLIYNLYAVFQYTGDRPLIVQFAANNSRDLADAAEIVAPYVL